MINDHFHDLSLNYLHSSVGSGRSPADRATIAGYDCCPCLATTGIAFPSPVLSLLAVRIIALRLVGVAGDGGMRLDDRCIQHFIQTLRTFFFYCIEGLWEILLV